MVSHENVLSQDGQGGPEVSPAEVRRKLAADLPPRSPTAGNALKHGLTSRKFLPPALQLALGEHLQRLRQDLQPRSYVEELFVREMARHAACLDVSEAAELPTLRVGAQAGAEFLGITDLAGIEDTDAALAGAVTSPATERMCTYRRLHERGFYTAWRELKALREQSQPAPAVQKPDCLWTDEAACEAHLRRRMAAADWSCPGCGHRVGHWLQKRARWECGGCGRQIGLRCGTVMERSPLTLVKWFAAIEAVTADLTLTAGRLAEIIDLPRLATVRSMLKKIHTALASPEADRLLTGLPRLVVAHGQPVAGAPENAVSRKQPGSKLLVDTQPRATATHECDQYCSDSGLPNPANRPPEPSGARKTLAAPYEN